MRVAAPWIVAGLIVLAAAVVVPVAVPVYIGASAPVGLARVTPVATPPQTVGVNLTDAPSFAPSRLSVNSGSNVTFTLTNVGNLSHSFTLARQANVTLNTSWTPQLLDQYFATNGSFINTTLAGGQSENVSLFVPTTTTPLTFEYVSVIAYQFQAGMRGTLSVVPTIGGNATLEDNTTDALSYIPNALEINTSGSHFPINVSMTLINLGALAHTFTLVAQPGVNLTPTNFSAYFTAHPPAANIQLNGGQASGYFLISQSGVFQYFCEEPGHFQNGMFGFLYVDVPVPSSAGASTTIVYVWVLAIAGGLIAVGVILSFIVSYSGRFPRRPSGRAPP